MTIGLSNLRISCLLFSMVLVASFLTSSCSEKEKPKKAIAPQINIDATLSEISQMAALVQLSMKVQKSTNCMVANSFDTTNLPRKNPDKQKSGTDVYLNKIISEMVDSYKNLCSLFIEAEKTTGPVFENIKRERKLPNELYVFSVFSKTSEGNEDGASFEEQEVGLFDSQASCEVIEKLAHDKGIPVRQCHKWEDILKLLKKPTT